MAGLCHKGLRGLDYWKFALSLGGHVQARSKERHEWAITPSSM